MTSVIADFTSTTIMEPFDRAYESYPDAQVELERIVPTGGEKLPFFWVWDDDIEGFVNELVASAPVDVLDVDLIELVEGGAILTITWHDSNPLAELFDDPDVVLMASEGNAESWWVRIRAPDRKTIAQFLEEAERIGMDLQLSGLYSLVELMSNGNRRITEKQLEALELAYKWGYFDSPRGCSLEDIGKELGVSQRAVSKRIRGAVKHAVGGTLAGFPESSDITYSS